MNRIIILIFIHIITLFSTNLLVDVRDANALNFSAATRGVLFQFNYPGARANGMGGAFVAIADDATAAYTNPAGLTIINEPEIALEYKYTSYENSQVVDASFTYFEVEHELQEKDLSFLSFAHPTENATFMLYQHELINSKTKVNSNTGPSYPVYQNFYNIEVQTVGVSGGFKISQELSFGIGVGFDELTIATDTYIYDEITVAADLSAPHGYSYNDSAKHFSAGLLWSYSDSFNVGVAYKQGPKFEHYSSQIPDDFNSREVTKIPDVYSLGVSFSPLRTLTLSSEVNYIKYSQLAEDLQFSFYNSELYYQTMLTPPEGNFVVDDGYDVRVGLEYVFSIRETPCAVRVGYHYDPQHTIYYVQNYQAAWLPNEEAFEELFPKEKDQHIGTFGFGVAPSEIIQFDIAGSWGDKIQEYTTSMVYRFE